MLYVRVSVPHVSVSLRGDRRDKKTTECPRTERPSSVTNFRHDHANREGVPTQAAWVHHPEEHGTTEKSSFDIRLELPIITGKTVTNASWAFHLSGLTKSTLVLLSLFSVAHPLVSSILACEAPRRRGPPRSYESRMTNRDVVCLRVPTSPHTAARGCT